jgi:hypothetical protein
MLLFKTRYWILSVLITKRVTYYRLFFMCKILIFYLLRCQYTDYFDSLLFFSIGFVLKFEIRFQLANADALCVTSL